MATIPTIKEDSIITIQVNGSFYARVQHLIMYMLESLEPQRIQEIFEKINSNQIDEPLAAHIQTLVVLMNEIEREADSQGKIEETEIEDSSETQS
jgi:hypothetical protein